MAYYFCRCREARSRISGLINGCVTCNLFVVLNLVCRLSFALEKMFNSVVIAHCYHTWCKDIVTGTVTYMHFRSGLLHFNQFANYH